MCEELFRGKLEVTLVPDCYEKSDASAAEELPIRDTSKCNETQFYY